jgi:hypothetical protein
MHACMNRVDLGMKTIHIVININVYLWFLQGIYKEIKFTRKWQGKIQKLKEIARISVTYTSYKS